jgi:hypothetical protein
MTTRRGKSSPSASDPRPVCAGNGLAKEGNIPPAWAADVDRFGYLRAVNGATLAFMFLFGLKGLLEGASSAVPFPDYLWSFPVPIIVMGAFFWLFAFATAALPFFATYALARRLGVRNVLYYAVCGALTGLVLTPVFVAVPPKILPQSEFWQDCLDWAPILTATGTCGALAFWHKTGRYLERASVQGDPAALP